MRFSKWTHWSQRNNIDGIHFPGIYAIALADRSIEGQTFELIEAIAYFGMTNAIGGLRSRLYAFNQTIIGKKGHGGAKRFITKHTDSKWLAERLFVSVYPVACSPNSGRPSDLRKMGKVAQLEYEYFARYVEAFGRLPEFNDQKRSPKSRV
ncbi:hypothetical protein [Coraliomargarita akajimensis]|uniref:GIY-YIG domain-containing protein n=1 Tax=Coraliomargarita akajimensis (strain DSM 45221 / IAM 15411 / JCM 23193 / KCTC 12865 / 04OKA010-24) TaxID=583355 RepID=D5ENS8_CORAD|nr:hypothetical protein [Coraliomargarita akajimensis]ADE53587.1 hypothetical protein Caka_0562 [Coraliomargarita akajimensis DSM 45221]